MPRHSPLSKKEGVHFVGLLDLDYWYTELLSVNVIFISINFSFPGDLYALHPASLLGLLLACNGQLNVQSIHILLDEC